MSVREEMQKFRKDLTFKAGLRRAPQYGGMPVILNEVLHAAHEDEKNIDDDAVATVRQIKKRLFRNCRSEADQAAFDKDGRERFIEKYGKAGIVALSVTDAQKKMGKLSKEEQLVLIKEINAAEAEKEKEAEKEEKS